MLGALVGSPFLVRRLAQTRRCLRPRRAEPRPPVTPRKGPRRRSPLVTRPRGLKQRQITAQALKTALEVGRRPVQVAITAVAPRPRAAGRAVEAIAPAERKVERPPPRIA